ncbi:hypothetical protein H8356DRAFT_1278238 [Neocallimastix lanati (nom. inval.)]|nr:hypothetical protein H8356DRAFT_1278238 [Neocallimastix sp. JGI-2020a]
MVTQFFEKSLQTNEENIHTYENITSINLHNDDDYIYNDDKNKVLLKEKFFFFCKDNICVESDYGYSNDYIEIPDKNGNVTKYSCNTCSYDEIKNKE